MKRILLTILCLGVLGTTGCYYDPALSGPVSVDVGVGATTVEQPTTGTPTHIAYTKEMIGSLGGGDGSSGGVVIIIIVMTMIRASHYLPLSIP
jgi:hypothetical protein